MANKKKQLVFKNQNFDKSSVNFVKREKEKLL